MTKDTTQDCWRVVYSDGGVFYTSAQTASEFVLDRVFMLFMVLCVFMFSSLMLALDIPFIPQIILFGAGVVSTFFWLSVFISINIGINRLFNIKTIYTALLLFPMQVMNAIFMNYILNLFGTSYADGFNGMVEISVRTLIIFVCLDIFHGKFVAVQHSTYVPPEAVGAQSANTPMVQETSKRAVHRADPVQPEPAADPAPAPAPASSAKAQAAPTGPESEAARASKVIVAKETFDLARIVFIKSEDHYLFIQSDTQSTMVRGKLSEVTAEIDVAWGVQVNRSVWVAFAAVDQVKETASGRLDVTMNDGSVFRVAETRRVFFQHCFEQLERA